MNKCLNECKVIEIINYLRLGLSITRCFMMVYANDDKVSLRTLLYFLSISRNLIYIDNPVGTGYSFTRNDKYYASNETQIARDIHNALNFSQNNNFFVIGESYSGKYILYTHTHISILMNANLRLQVRNFLKCGK
ncbi:hypothetical protein HZH66_011007 [Vespula vulgaris]|uniref:Carboxypeptidase n=1 Tax=Vespula vulgaris TaxID=7454 RepID=A0A834JHN2_VESVU|nr:hypothetical protein HZH66_011007 [Vespula vulgaris]